MILTALLLGGALLVGGLVVAFWDDLLDFLKRATKKVLDIIDGIAYGCRVFVKKIRDGIEEISRHYSKVGQNWQETTVTKVVSANDVPSEILERAANGKELDITDEMEMKLANA